MNKKKLTHITYASLFTTLLLTKAHKVFAAGLVPENTDDVGSFIVLAINISQYILGIVGSLTLLMFIVGGFQFMTSTGSPEKVSKAKKTITAAIVGLLIVFSSWLIINFVVESLGFNPTNSSMWRWDTLMNKN